MELVRGTRITEYCDQNQLPTRERLKLFILVCQAIQHAHQKGIIHRDIKPLNILVTLHDGDRRAAALPRIPSTGTRRPFSLPVITNRAGALFHAQNAASLSSQGGFSRFDNAGTFRLSGNSGTTALASGVRFNNHHTVEIRNGILAASGGYTSSSNALLHCALGGTIAGTGFGQLRVGGTVNLNCSLSVDLVNGFNPAINDSFAVLTAGTRNGTFAIFVYPSSLAIMQMNNTANSFVVSVTDVPAVPRPMLLPPELVGPNLRLTWTAVSNATYRLGYKTHLGLADWSVLSGDVTGLSNTASKLDMLTSSNRFYQVRVLPE